MKRRDERWAMRLAASSGVVVAMALALTCCPKTEHPQTDPEPELIDGSTRCARACGKLKQLGCPEGDSTDAGETCEAFCAKTRAMLDVACVSRAASLTEVRACHVRCQKNPPP